MFGCSLEDNIEEHHEGQDAHDAQEKGSQGASDKSGNINEVSIDSIKLTSKGAKDKEQLALEKEFENQMKNAGLGLKNASQGEDDIFNIPER